jgi:phosphoribosylaminoimidazolecarboxamide formyltransferase/IMP cyclohydrolase
MSPKRALLSVFDKDGLVELGQGLLQRGYELVSTGGTARVLREAELEVMSVSDVTGFPEILEGRVKTLHPRIHAGILARRGVAKHREALATHDIPGIDVVVVNLYPFEDKVAKGAPFAEALENIDIGGPTMVRAAAKNFADVAVVVDPADYRLLLDQLDQEDGIDAATRLYFAQKAFRHTARYEAAIASYFSQVEVAETGYGVAETDQIFPARLRLDFDKVRDLRYGENPHQRAALYADPGATLYSVASARQLQGKELSFNNILDLDAAWRLVTELHTTACAVIKHTNPSGVGLGKTTGDAFERAWACDPRSAFGSIVAVNRKLDTKTAEKIAEVFVEAVIAPGFEAGARKALEGKKSLRLMDMDTTGIHNVIGFDQRRVLGGLLAQQWDMESLERDKCDTVTKRRPSEDEWRALELAWTVAKHVKSNAIVYATAEQTVGIGAGQMSRVDAAELGARKAQLPLEGTAVGSDAFFPFRDGIDALAGTGARAVIQPGGSVRDDEVIEAANEHDLAMVFTGVRHFRH